MTIQDIQEFKVWKGIDKENPVWASRGFACSSYEDAKDLMDYIYESDDNLLLRVVKRSQGII